jgi:hypothetical protein
VLQKAFIISDNDHQSGAWRDEHVYVCVCGGGKRERERFGEGRECVCVGVCVCGGVEVIWLVNNEGNKVGQ